MYGVEENETNERGKERSGKGEERKRRWRRKRKGKEREKILCPVKLF